MKLDKIKSKAKIVRNNAIKIASEKFVQANDIVEQVNLDMQTKRYNPIFEEDYLNLLQSKELPKIIAIVDGHHRDGIEVCKNSIGWISGHNNKKALRVLHLYESYIEKSSLLFYTVPRMNGVYYQDLLDNKRYIDLEQYYEIISKERAAELCNIAHDLGAKECRIEFYEAQNKIIKKGKNAKIDVKEMESETPVDGNLDFQHTKSNENMRTSHVLLEKKFMGCNIPKRPDLYWFRDDKVIQSLINQRCCKDNDTLESSVEIGVSKLGIMTAEMGAKVDATLQSLDCEASLNFSQESKRRELSKLIFRIRF